MRLAVAFLAAASASFVSANVLEYLKCQVCEVQQVSGQIDGCCCDAKSADEANTKHFLPILHRLSRTRYFRYFKVDLWRPCPFWDEDGMCAMRDCAVCECEPDEVPVCWQREDAAAAAAAARKQLR